MDIFDHDDRLLRQIDNLMNEAARKAGSRWGCGPGRTDCCIGPFPINLLDARRLQRGLEDLAVRDPARAAELSRRARKDADLLRRQFPGDPDTGILVDDDESQQRFFNRHESVPCPALDPATGLCDLYDQRPFTCRTYGPPLRIGDEELPACTYCFEECTPEETEALRVEPDPEGLEDAILDQLEREDGFTGETIVAFALAGLTPRRSES
jgi:Fe-S-cluster containining protein